VRKKRITIQNVRRESPEERAALSCVIPLNEYLIFRKRNNSPYARQPCSSAYIVLSAFQSDMVRAYLENAVDVSHLESVHHGKYDDESHYAEPDSGCGKNAGRCTPSPGIRESES
jgi:hypothetical protein